MSPERRPRIPEDMAARIDRARGAVPFERWVRDALHTQLGHQAFEPTVENYLLAIDESLQDGAYDQVTSFDEWQTFRRALEQWMTENEAEWQDIAAGKGD